MRHDVFVVLKISVDQNMHTYIYNNMFFNHVYDMLFSLIRIVAFVLIFFFIELYAYFGLTILPPGENQPKICAKIK